MRLSALVAAGGLLGHVLLSSPSPCAAPARLRLATWNVAWLAAPGTGGETPRTSEDLARLRRYADRLGAEVVALQEVDGPAAAATVFDPARWNLHFAQGPGGPQRCGFAWRKGIRARPLPDLPLRPRPAADLEVTFGGRTLRLLSLHLKSGCHDPRKLATDRNAACAVLFSALPILERWIDARAREGTAFAVLGDFNRRMDDSDPFWREIDDADPPGADLADPFATRDPVCWGGRFDRYIDRIVLGRETAGWLDPVSPRERPYDPADAGAERALSDHCPLELELAPGAPAGAPPVIEASQAGRHLGEIVTACGTVAGATYLEDSATRPTFLNLGAPYPRQDLAVLVPADRRAAFGRPEATWKGRRICVTGAVGLHRGRPQVVLTDPGLLRADGATARP